MKLVVASLLLAIPAISAPAETGFEVSSIRPAQPGATVQDARVYFRGDRFEAKAMTVGDLLDMLAGTQSLYRVTGGPSWMRTDRYDVVAKADHEVAPPGQYAAVMSLLIDRFKLQSHKETRDIPGLVLRAPRMPAGIKPATANETYSVQRNPQAGHFIFTAAHLADLTNLLSQATHLPVTDETELKSAYDFVIDAPPQPGEDLVDRIRGAVEAVGFRLESRRVSVEITVVDRCERPTEN
jgi:uncharacterized protein (TIGR03435 family)